MEPAQIALSIATIVMSGVVSGVVTFQLNSRRDSSTLKRQKLELLHEAYTGFIEDLSGNWITYMAVMTQKLTYDQANEIAIKSAGSKRNYRTLEMLVSIYFPNLEGFLLELTSIREEASSVLAAHKRQYQAIGPHTSEKLPEMKFLVDELTACEERFLAALRLEAKKINKKIPGAA